MDLDVENKIIIFGITKTGHSVTIYVKNYTHSFYVGTDDVETEEEMYKKYEKCFKDIKN